MATNIVNLLTFVAVAVSMVPGVSAKRLEPRIAMNCGSVNMHVDLVTGQWIPDSNTSIGCLSNHDDILHYCQKVFSHLGSIQFVVEDNKEEVITNWCPLQQTECMDKFSVVPYRCLVGEFVSDALMVPNECRFSHIHNTNTGNDVCLSHNEWRSRAEADCNQNNWTLRDYGMLLPCKANFSGVEFVCCPPASISTSVATNGPEATTKQPITKDMYFMKKVKNTGEEHEMFVEARERVIKGQESKMSKVMKDWQEAEKGYQNLMKKDPKAAEKMKKDMTVQFQKTVNALEVEAESEREGLRTTHEERVSGLLTDRRTKIFNKLISVLQGKDPKPKVVLHTLDRFVKAIKKNQAHILSHYKHLQDIDPAMAEDRRPLLLTHMQDMDASLDSAIDMIRKKAAVYEAIHTDIDALVGGDTEHIQMLQRSKPAQYLDQRPPQINVKLLDDVTAKKDNIIQSEATTKILQPEPAPTKLLKTQALRKFPGKAFIKEYQSQLVKRPQKTNSKIAPAFHDTSTTRVGASSRFGAPVVALGLACGIIAIIMVIGAAGLVIRHKSRRLPVNQGFVELDPNMTLEQKHIAMMQSNGYENPTYKYFEVDK